MLFSVYYQSDNNFLFGDAQIDKEWGTMLYNLEHNQVSSRSINNVPVPNLFMPPLYAWFLFSIKFLINDLNLFLNITFIIQILFIDYFNFFDVSNLFKFFDKKVSLIGQLFIFLSIEYLCSFTNFFNYSSNVSYQFILSLFYKILQRIKKY